jgi:hypothetical protein
MILWQSVSGRTLPTMIGRPGAVVGLAVSLVTALLTPGPHTPPPAPPPGHPNAPVELRDQRTDFSTTFQHPNGARTVVLSSGPIRARHGAQWTPLDLTLHRDPDGGVRPAAAPYPVWLSGGGATPDAAAVRGPGGANTALAWDTALPAPTLQGSTATYPNARPGANLVVRATRTGFIGYLAPTGQAAATLSADVPLRLRLTGEGAGSELLSSSAPLTGPVGTLADVAVAGRVAASAVAPTRAPFDTTVQNNAPTGVLWADPDLRIGSYDGNTVARSWITWDLGPLHAAPPGQVQQASLRLYSEWAASCPPQGQSQAQPQAWQVWSTPPVGPDTRWGNQPPAEKLWATSTAAKGPAGCGPGWFTLDLTGLVRSWAQSGAATGTVMLRAVDEQNQSSWRRFSSGDGEHVPALGVTIAPATP